MNNYELIIKNPCFGHMGYIKAVANLQDKHDRSAPSDYHWKILKCRMLIFSNSSIMACPDKEEVKKIHIIFNKFGDDYDKLTSLLLKFSLTQEGTVGQVSPEIYQMSFQYTMLAKLAPMWNTLGLEYLVNNRNFLLSKEPQEGIKYQCITNEHFSTLKVKPVKILLYRANCDYLPGEYVRVLPSLNKATVEESCELTSKYGIFKSYKDLRRHWKNIGAYKQTAHLMVSDHRRPWTLATPVVSQMRCRPLRKEYALFLKVFGSYWSGNTAGDNIFHSFVNSPRDKCDRRCRAKLQPYAKPKDQADRKGPGRRRFEPLGAGCDPKEEVGTGVPPPKDESSTPCEAAPVPYKAAVGGPV
ncbi:hypothetical protein evm_012618 [Chilo suppressalis]|nr:hypothetical protein evm_012618 [Chilo suppressalis]